MKNNTQHIDDLLVKHLTGEATEAEAQQVQQWLAMDDDNRRYFDHFRLIWEESVHLASTTQVDENAAWGRFQHRVQQKVQERSQARVWSMNHPLLRAAVITGVVIGIAALTYFFFHNDPGKVIALDTIQAIDSVKTGSLPDGSEVVLNKKSQLSYPRHFTGSKRVIQLNGEAFFNVRSDKEKPFEVHTNDVTITVLGTSFNVRSRGDTTEIIVETGVVRVDLEQKSVTLKAGERAITRQKDALLEKQSTTDQIHTYYRSRKFVCDNTPLWKLVEKLNEAYNVQIIIENPELRNTPYSGTFIEESLDNIFHVLQLSLDFSVIKQNGQIILR